MKKILPLVMAATSLLFVAAGKYIKGFRFEEQVQVNIIPPITLCGSPGARTILEIMDTTRQMAPLLDNLGNYGMPVNTKHERAQKFFNQGINLYYGFNHLEAYRSFKEAARLDPNLAIAYWGQALCLGPNINLPMDAADIKTVYAAVQKALALMPNASAKEKTLIEALSKRYTAEALTDRKPLDEAYAQAMAQVAQQFPNDLDINTLYAEALMDLHPWDFWKDGKARPWTEKPVEILANVIKQYPSHPGANHLNIHILEASPNPDLAAASADRLNTLVPGSGHLVHMPSHIYIRVGRYFDGVIANERAVKTDEDYIVQCKVQGVYPLFYYPHNYHFLLACAQMAGMSEKAEATATSLQRTVPPTLMTDPNFVTLQHWYVMPLFNKVRFGQWNAVLASEPPSDSLKYAKAVWHYSMGMASVRTKKIGEARSHLTHLEKALTDPFMENTISGFNSFRSILTIGTNVLAGEIATSEKQYDKAISFLNKAVEIEDGLLYQEPPDWYHPTRQILGAILLEANKPQLAEQRFREDLMQYRNNGWSLYGLHKSLMAQGKKKDAADIKKQFDQAFSKADIKLNGVRF